MCTTIYQRRSIIKKYNVRFRNTISTEECKNDAHESGLMPRTRLVDGNDEIRQTFLQADRTDGRSSLVFQLEELGNVSQNRM